MKPTLSMNSNHVMVRELKDYLMIALGMIFYGIGWTVFLLPNDLPSGAVPGIASIVYWGTGLPVQYTYFAINALLLLLSLKILGWKFSMKTVYAVFVLTFFLSVIQRLTSGLQLLHDQPFMAWGLSFAVAVSVSLSLRTGVREVRILLQRLSTNTGMSAWGV